MNCNEIINLLHKNYLTYEDISQLHETLTSLDKRKFLQKIILEQPEVHVLQEFNYKIIELQNYNIKKLTNLPPEKIPIIDLNYIAKLIDIERIVTNVLKQNSSPLANWQVWIPNWFSH